MAYRKSVQSTSPCRLQLQTSLKKLDVQPIQAIEEVNMFKEGGNVTHFAAPKGTFPHNTEGEKFAYRIAITNAGENLIVHASVPSNTFANYGNGEDKELTELAPGILNQLGPEASADVPSTRRIWCGTLAKLGLSM